MKINRMKEYIIKKNKYDLSETRINYILYLSDWKYAIDYNETISNQAWLFDSGPVLVSLFKKEELDELTFTEEKIIDKAIEVSLARGLPDLHRFVYSTYPIMTSNRGEALCLVNLAKSYERIKHLI